MTFVHGLLLGGLLLVGVPIVLHLIMRQKPKHVLFPAFRFLQQRLKTNQRKLKLRHLLLLLLRMLLIALIVLALARPRVLDQRLNFTGEQAAAVVLVLDTSMSMEYEFAKQSRLDEAKRRALELVDSLPNGSWIALLDTSEPASSQWLNNRSTARERIEALTLKPASGTVTSRLAEAYRLFADWNQRAEAADQVLPRFLYVFSDRAQECWDASQTASLQAAQQRVPDPPINGIFIDVGVPDASDLAITRIELPRQAVPANLPVVLRATVQATGADYDTEIICRILGDSNSERKPVRLRAGQSQVITFERRGLGLGLHQAEISLATSDSLPFNNMAFATFEVHGPRQILVLADNPDEAAIWKAALDLKGLFRCDVLPISQARDLGRDDLARYRVVCLFHVANPGRDLWAKLHAYVQAGGGLAVLPGGREMTTTLAAYNDDETAQRLLPGQPRRIITHKNGRPWHVPNYRHPITAPFREWGLQDTPIDFFRYVPKAAGYWQVEAPPDNVIAFYEGDERHPALLERNSDQTHGSGRVLLFTTPMDSRSQRLADGRPWNDYDQSSFYMVLANTTMSYLAGDDVDADLNFLCGQVVPVTLPATPRFPTYTLLGPGLSGAEAILARAEGQNQLLIHQATQPANYRLVGADPRWSTGFSLNVAPSQSQLTPVPVEQIEAVLGEDAVLPLDHDTPLQQALQARWPQPVELLPWLMILVLLLLAGESLLANLFYRQASSEAEVNK
ncbi:MAG: BatA domain-containing protein [Gemmataceae bacterium]